MAFVCLMSSASVCRPPGPGPGPLGFRKQRQTFKRAIAGTTWPTRVCAGTHPAPRLGPAAPGALSRFPHWSTHSSAAPAPWVRCSLRAPQLGGVALAAIPLWSLAGHLGSSQKAAGTSPLGPGFWSLWLESGKTLAGGRSKRSRHCQKDPNSLVWIIIRDSHRSAPQQAPFCPLDSAWGSRSPGGLGWNTVLLVLGPRGSSLAGMLEDSK